MKKFVLLVGFLVSMPGLAQSLNPSFGEKLAALRARHPNLEAAQVIDVLRMFTLMETKRAFAPSAGAVVIHTSTADVPNAIPEREFQIILAAHLELSAENLTDILSLMN